MTGRCSLALLVVLAVGAVLLAPQTGSTMHPEMRGTTFGVVGDTVLRNGGGLDSGDDDRWGDSGAWAGDPENPDPDTSDDGSDGGVGEGGLGHHPDAKSSADDVQFRLRLLLGPLLLWLSLM